MGLMWGGGVRLFISSHVNYSVNSVSHSFGYRSFATRENSTNNPWLALFSFGEHWHNNHYTCSSSAFFGLRWWEIDIGGVVLRMLERLKIVTHVVRPGQSILEKLKVNTKAEENL